MRRAAETANAPLGALPAVAGCARVVDGGGAVDGAAAAAAPGAIVKMVGAGKRILDFGEGGDEACRIEDVFAELGGEGEEAERCCIGGRVCWMVTTHGAESGVSSEVLKDRVRFACEADGAACKGGRGGERGEYALSCIEGGDVTDEVELECRRSDMPEDIRGCKRPFVQDSLAALG